MSGRTIFRETAVEAYRRGLEKDVIPRFVSRPITVCRWLLIVVVVAAAGLSWEVRVPAYTSVAGVIVDPREAWSLDETGVVLFVPPDRSALVRVGRSVPVHVAASDSVVRGSVAAVEPGVLTPAAARARYRILASDVVSQPSVAVVVRLERTPPSGSDAGTRVTARLATGSQRLAALFGGPA